jgi:hypothetical protein
VKTKDITMKNEILEEIWSTRKEIEKVSAKFAGPLMV